MNNKSEPLVSIIIPVYNGANFLSEAIESALQQTYENIEILVVNDGSTDMDATANVARDYADKIRYFEKKNGGVASALNYGIVHARGEYISWLSHDDLYSPEKIKVELDMLETSETMAIACCGFSVIDEKGLVLETQYVPERAQKDTFCALAIDPFMTINGCALLIPKDIFGRYGVFDETLKTTQDYDMWARIAEDIPFLYIDEALVSYRSHPKQDSKSKIETCIREGDALHARLVEALPFERIIQYFEKDIKKIEEVISIYYGGLHRKTWYLLLKKTGQYFQKETRQGAKFLLEKVLCCFHEDNHAALDLLWKKKQKKRVLFLCSSWMTGGVNRMLSALSGPLSDDFEIIVTAYENLVGDHAPLDPRAFFMRVNSTEVTPNFSQRMVMLCALLDVDVLIGNPNYLREVLRIYDIAKNTDLKTVAYNHGNYFFSYLYPTELAFNIVEEEKGFSSADVAMYLYKSAVKFHSLYYTNGMWMPNFAPEVRRDIDITKKNPDYILAVGRYDDEIKRVDLMLSAFSKILKRHPNAELVIVGKMDLQEHVPLINPKSIGDVIRELGIPMKNLHLRGALKPEETLEYYAKASIFLLTSESEGCPTAVILEASAYGAASITFNIPGMEEFITDGENGFIVPQGDIDAMAEKAVLLMEDDGLRHKMARNAQDFAEGYSLVIVQDRWRCFLRGLTETPKHEIVDFLHRQFPVQQFPEDYLMRQLMQTFDLFVERNPPSSYSWSRPGEPIRLALEEVIEESAGLQPSFIAETETLELPVNPPLEPFGTRLENRGLVTAVAMALEQKKGLRFIVYFMRTVKYEGMVSGVTKTFRKIGRVLLRKP